MLWIGSELTRLWILKIEPLFTTPHLPNRTSVDFSAAEPDFCRGFGQFSATEVRFEVGKVDKHPVRCGKRGGKGGEGRRGGEGAIYVTVSSAPASRDVSGVRRRSEMCFGSLKPDPQPDLHQRGQPDRP